MEEEYFVSDDFEDDKCSLTDDNYWHENDLLLAAELGKSLIERNRDLESQISALQNTGKDLQQEIDLLSKQNTTLKELNSNKMKLYEEFDRQFHDLESANRQMTSEIASLQREICESNATISRLEESGELARKENSKLRTQLHSAEREALLSRRRLSRSAGVASGSGGGTKITTDCAVGEKSWRTRDQEREAEEEEGEDETYKSAISSGMRGTQKGGAAVRRRADSDPAVVHCGSSAHTLLDDVEAIVGEELNEQQQQLLMLQQRQVFGDNQKWAMLPLGALRRRLECAELQMRRDQIALQCLQEQLDTRTRAQLELQQHVNLMHAELTRFRTEHEDICRESAQHPQQYQEQHGQPPQPRLLCAKCASSLSPACSTEVTAAEPATTTNQNASKSQQKSTVSPCFLSVPSSISSSAAKSNVTTAQSPPQSYMQKSSIHDDKIASNYHHHHPFPSVSKLNSSARQTNLEDDIYSPLEHDLENDLESNLTQNSKIAQLNSGGRILLSKSTSKMEQLNAMEQQPANPAPPISLLAELERKYRALVEEYENLIEKKKSETAAATEISSLPPHPSANHQVDSTNTTDVAQQSSSSSTDMERRQFHASLEEILSGSLRKERKKMMSGEHRPQYKQLFKEAFALLETSKQKEIQKEQQRGKPSAARKKNNKKDEQSPKQTKNH